LIPTCQIIVINIVIDSITLKMYEKSSLLRYRIIIHTLLTMYGKKVHFYVIESISNRYRYHYWYVIDNIDINKKWTSVLSCPQIWITINKMSRKLLLDSITLSYPSLIVLLFISLEICVITVKQLGVYILNFFSIV
jgi:hypothetical protein